MHSTLQLLREILLEGKVHTQTEIQQAFKAQQINISQPKISRLLHQIGAVKLIDKTGKTLYRLPHETGLLHELSAADENSSMTQWILDIVANEALIIIHTTPGAAAMVARIIDKNRLDLDVLGSLAGDDTIFVAVQSSHNILAVQKKIAALFER